MKTAIQTFWMAAIIPSLIAKASVVQSEQDTDGESNITHQLHRGGGYNRAGSNERTQFCKVEFGRVCFIPPDRRFSKNNSHTVEGFAFLGNKACTAKNPLFSPKIHEHESVLLLELLHKADMIYTTTKVIVHRTTGINSFVRDSCILLQ